MLHTEHLASQQECDRFIREAQILEQLKHPSILSIIDVGVHEGSPYLVTEYLPNGSLRDRMRHQSPYQLPVQEIMAILLHIGQALHYAHEQRIIHRDIKPENILFNAQGGAQLADFGIATALTTKSYKSTAIIGTPEYMAPEQFEGTVSKESDQYALACLAYELFTGRPPFTAPTPISVLSLPITQETCIRGKKMEEEPRGSNIV